MAEQDQNSPAGGPIGKALAWLKKIPNRPQAACVDAGHDGPEIRLDENMDDVDRDESAPATDDTAETLAAMRQENAHSLERDLADPFFWKLGRPDAVAGMAKVYLRSRCPTPYWRSLANASQYGLWGAVAMARLLAAKRGAEPQLSTLTEFAFLPLRDQGRLCLDGAPESLDPEWRAELALADGIPMSRGASFMPDIHLQSAMRALFCAVAMDRPIDWPDLPARLSAEAAVPKDLPCLWIDIGTMEARAGEASSAQAMAFWASDAAKGENLLVVPDWASWMLAALDGSSAPKW